jgi:hypothetical protein
MGGTMLPDLDLFSTKLNSSSVEPNKKGQDLQVSPF